MVSVKEAHQDLLERYQDKDIHEWAMKIRHLSNCDDKTLKWGLAALFFVSIVLTIFGFNSVLVLAQEFSADSTINVGLVITAVVCAFFAGKADRGARTIIIDRRFRKLVGNDNLTEKYVELMTERAARSK